jgi:dihydrofolate reductase
MPPRISLIAAVARNGVIGRQGSIPWRIPGDLPRFKALTLGHPVIMGRRTWASLGRPLPGRRNIVLTRDAPSAFAGAEVCSTLQAALARCADAAEVFIIGGTEAYRAALPLAHRLLLTEIDADIDGDTVFPPFDRAQWVEAARQAHPPAADFAHPYAYVTYERPGAGLSR